VRLSRPCPRGRNDTTSTRLTDAVFFGEHLDTTRPGLTEIPALAAKGDYKACRKVFAAYVRGMLQPERHFSKVPAIQKNLADGVDYERAEKALKNIMSSCGFEWDFGEEGPVDWFSNPTYKRLQGMDLAAEPPRGMACAGPGLPGDRG